MKFLNKIKTEKMKTNTTIRSIVAMMVIFFAVTTTSCKKEENITPTAPVLPITPTVPVTPAVSMKPSFISTAENGITVRKQVYKYDLQGKLTSYESRGTSSDSVLIFNNNVVFKATNATVVGQNLLFNVDKTFKSLFLPNSQIDFSNNQTKLSRMIQPRLNNTPITLGEFAYSGNNLVTIGAEIRIDINYNNLPYQKGINEIPVLLKPIQYYKIMEMENATTTVLYDKLIDNVILNSGGGRIETHQYSYVFDANNRVTKITNTVTKTTATTSTQKVFVSIITY